MKSISPQARKIVDKFGGVGPLCKALKAVGAEAERDRTTVHRWMMAKASGGTGGIVPTSAQPDVKRAARNEGIVLSDKDWVP